MLIVFCSPAWICPRRLAPVILMVAVGACSGASEEAEQPNLFVPDRSVETSASTADPTTTQRSTTETEPTTTLETPLVDGSIDPASIDLVVYSTDIHPILEQSCASCHGADQAGSSGVVLSTAGQAADKATAIQLYTTAELMPPWPASRRSVGFRDDVSLPPLEIAMIARWVEDGAVIDVDPSTAIVPSLPPSFLAEPDVVMTAVGAPYVGDPERSDDYRCLVFDPGISEPEWILGTHFVPDRVEVVHHGIVKMASAELRDRADELDASSPEPGWSCYGGVGLEGRGGSLRDMGGWAPGTQPDRLPEGYAVLVEPGDFFVIQVHYHYNDEAPGDRSSYHLDLASDDELAAAGGSFESLTDALYLGPAEIPCYEGDTEPLCDRRAAIERVRSLYGPLVGAFPDFFMQQCGAEPSDFAAMTEGDAWSRCDLPVSNPGRITSVFGHMHELGASIRLTLNPDTTEEQILLDIPDWDFEWQLSYRPLDDIIIERGDTVRVECAWNRERAPYEAVGYIVWSDGTGDEMCYSSITTAPLD